MVPYWPPIDATWTLKLGLQKWDIQGQIVPRSAPSEGPFRDHLEASKRDWRPVSEVGTMPARPGIPVH